MFYVILNIVMCIVPFIYSSQIEQGKSKNSSKHMLENLSIIVSVLSFFFVIFLFCVKSQNVSLLTMFGKLVLVVFAFFSISVFKFCFLFSDIKPSKKFMFFVYILHIAAVYVIFAKYNSITFSNRRFSIKSEVISVLEMDYASIIYKVYFMVLPVFSYLALVIRGFACKEKLDRQNTFFISFLIVGLVAVFQLVVFAGNSNPFFLTLSTYCCFFAVYLLNRIANISVVYDFKYILKKIFFFIGEYIPISFFVGLLYAALASSNLDKSSKMILFILVILSGDVIITVIVNYVSKHHLNRGARYGRRIEEEFSQIDYSEESKTIIDKVVALLMRNTDASSVNILIESSDDVLSPVYSSSDFTKSSKEQITVSTSPLLKLLNLNKNVVLREHVLTQHYYRDFKDSLINLFDDYNSDALVILTEGIHIIGVIFLGKKPRGNNFTEYDASVLNNLNPHFFVFGYFVKNIANQELLGTVDKEIQYSGQIIQSIQENIDKIQNDKFDVGYISISTRNLGGDFVDFVKISDTQYLFVMGDVSGKGLNASMSMVILKSIIRTFLTEINDFKQIASKVNDFIKYNLPKGTFFAGIFAMLDFSDNTMYYINCGCPALFMYSEAYKNVIEIQGEGKILGFGKNISKLIKVKKIKLNPGDILLTCTDGLIESQSLRGDFFGKDNIQKSIMENRTYPAERIANFLHASLLDFTSKELEDDVSIVVFKCISN